MILAYSRHTPYLCGMWMICIKEWRQFFSSLAGYIAIVAFLLVCGLFLFVLPDTSILDAGYATLDAYFALAPWVLLFLVPTVTMRSFSEEYRTGTFELLKTFPLKPSQIVRGKFYGALLIVLLSLFPTVIYAFSLQALSTVGGIDIGSTIGSYIGLLLIGGVFCAIGICASSFTSNTVVAFITGAVVCLLLYTGFDAVSRLPFLRNGWDYYVQMLGVKFHYSNISRGVVDVRDLVYFIGIIAVSLLLTQRNVDNR